MQVDVFSAMPYFGNPLAVVLNGQVYLARDAHDQVWVGGESVTCIDGQVTL